MRTGLVWVMPLIPSLLVLCMPCCLPACPSGDPPGLGGGGTSPPRQVGQPGRAARPHRQAAGGGQGAEGPWRRAQGTARGRAGAERRGDGGGHGPAAQGKQRHAHACVWQFMDVCVPTCWMVVADGLRCVCVVLRVPGSSWARPRMPEQWQLHGQLQVLQPDQGQPHPSWWHGECGVHVGMCVSPW